MSVKASTITSASSLRCPAVALGESLSETDLDFVKLCQVHAESRLPALAMYQQPHLGSTLTQCSGSCSQCKCAWREFTPAARRCQQETLRRVDASSAAAHYRAILTAGIMLDHRNTLGAVAAVGCLLGCALMAFAGLVACPDCGRQVSARALLCPGCGCPGKAIAEAAQPAATNQPPARPAFHRSLIQVRSDQAEGWGVAVADGATVQVVTSLELLGAQSLELHSRTTTSVVAYVSIELADDCALARFRTTDTNLFALRWEAGSTEGFLVQPDQGTNGLRLVAASLQPDGTVNCPSGSTRPVAGTPVLSRSTNLLAVIASGAPDAPKAVTASPARRWVPLQPSDFRRQMALVCEARTARPASRRQLANRLREAAWSTAYLKEFAAQLAAQLDTKDKP